MAARSTCARNAHIRATQAELDSNVSAGGIAHKSRHTERRDLSRSFLNEPDVLVFDFLNTADTCADDYAGAVWVFFREIE